MTAPYRPLTTSTPSPPLTPGSRDHSPTLSLRALELSESFVDDPDQTQRPRQNRSNTVTSFAGFEFEHELLPLTLSGEGADAEAAKKDDEKHVGLWHAIGLVVGMQVGSGIFSSPGVIVASVGSTGASLMVWVVSGLLAWTGASSFVELGCAIPVSGGAQAYLAYSFGPLLSYLYTWGAVSSLKPGSTAIISLIFGLTGREYVNRMVYHAFSSDPEALVPEWTFKITAIVAILVVTILNLASRTMGANFGVIMVAIKITALVFIAILGLLTLIRNGPGPAFTAQTFFEGTSTQPSSYAIALYSGLWAFDGWDQCNFVAGEMRNPNKHLPAALHSSMSIVLILFVLANCAYFVALSPEIVASSNTVALDFGRVTIGKFGAVVFSTLVAISCFGALSNSFYTTGHLIFAASKDHHLPEIFGRLHPRRRTPDHAMALQAGLTSFFIIFGGGFRRLINFFSVVSWTFYLLTVLGLLVLRVKEPHLERPYRTWIGTPIIFCLVAMFLLLMPVFAAPLEAFAALVFMATGIPMYYLTARSRQHLRNRTVDDHGGFGDTIAHAWHEFKADLGYTFFSSSSRMNEPVRVGDGEERRGMLRTEQLEMSER